MVDRDHGSKHAEGYETRASLRATRKARWSESAARAAIVLAASIVLSPSRPASAAPAQAPRGGAARVLSQIAGYQSWPKFARYADGPVRSHAHDDLFVVAFHNRVASSAVRGVDVVYPDASLIVKENRRRGAKTPESLSVMARFNQSWFWMEATPGGKVVVEGKQPQAGSLQHCARCHARAGADMVYSDGVD